MLYVPSIYLADYVMQTFGGLFFKDVCVYSYFAPTKSTASDTADIDLLPNLPLNNRQALLTWYRGCQWSKMQIVQRMLHNLDMCGLFSVAQN